MAHPERRAVFLDRDGTVIEDPGYLRDASQVHLLAGAGEALAQFQRHGFALVLISNQSGIGRGLITPREAEQVHQALLACLADHRVQLDAAFYCPHAPVEQCPCRKPSPEMLLRAARELKLDLARSFMLGDKASDIEAGRRAGCRTILLSSDATGLASEMRPDAVASNWTEVLEQLAQELRQHAPGNVDSDVGKNA